MKGRFIVLEGIDGSGTTTQLRRLAAHLEQQGLSVYETAEPSESSCGRLLRQALRGDIPLGEATLALLFAADRLEHVRTEIEPHLASGGVVLCDRYLLSSLAYQSVHLSLEWVRSLNARALRPDLSVFLRVSPEVAATRRSARGGDEELFDGLERQRAVAARYEAVLHLEDVGPTCAIDAEQSMDTVTTMLANSLRERFGA